MTPAEIHAQLVSHYLMLAYLASLGAIQVVAAGSGLRGLWLISRPVLARRLGWALAVGAFVFYFFMPLWVAGPWGRLDPEGPPGRGTSSFQQLTLARNINDVGGGLAGAHQALWSAVGFGGALVTSALVGSLRESRRDREGEAPPDGFEALEQVPLPLVPLRAIRRRPPVRRGVGST